MQVLCLTVISMMKLKWLIPFQYHTYVKLIPRHLIKLIPANDEGYLLFLSEQEACSFASYSTRVTSPIPPAISMWQAFYFVSFWKISNDCQKNLTSKLHLSFNGPFVEVILGQFRPGFSPVNSLYVWSITNLTILPGIIHILGFLGSSQSQLWNFHFLNWR